MDNPCELKNSVVVGNAKLQEAEREIGFQDWPDTLLMVQQVKA